MSGGRAELIPRYLMLVGADVASRAIAFLLMVVIVRHFGAAGFGKISLATSVIAYAVVAASCGLEIYAVRNVAKDPGGMRGLAGTVLLLRFCLGVGVYLALLFLSLIVPPLRDAAGLIALFGLSVFTTALSLSWIAEGLQKTHVLAIANFCIQAFGLGTLLAALKLGWSLWAIPVAQVTAEGLVALGLFVWVCRCAGRPSRPAPVRAWPGILRQSAPIGGARILRSVALGSDLILLGLFVSMEELGWYTGAYRLFLLGMVVGAQYFIILFPRLARLAPGPDEELRREVGASLRLILTFAVPASTLVALFAGDLLQALFGPSFRQASNSFLVLLLALVAWLISSLFRNTLIALGRQRTDLGMVAAASVIHITSKLLLIPLIGIAGAGIGTLVGEVGLAILCWWALRRTWGSARSPDQAVSSASERGAYDFDNQGADRVSKHVEAYRGDPMRWDSLSPPCTT